MKNNHLRMILCFFMCCALLFSCVARPVSASALGATAAITAASTVLTPAGLVVGATFVALGLAAAANPEGFQNMVNAGVSALESAGTWVKDGMVELVRTVNSDGLASFYVNSGLMESLRSMLLSNGSVYEGISLGGSKVNLTQNMAKAYSMAIKNPYVYIARSSSGNPLFFGGNAPFVVDNGVLRCPGWQFIMYSYNSQNSIITQDPMAAYNFNSFGVSPGFSYDTAYYSGHASDSDVHVANFPSVPVDGTSARQWSEEYTDRGLNVVQGGGDSDPDHDPENNGTWFWSIMIPLTAAELYAMSQADEWSGQTPQEFDDYTTQTEFEILAQPEIEFGHQIEIAPITQPSPEPEPEPDPGTDPDPDPDPDPGVDPSPDPGVDPSPDPGVDPNPDPGVDPSPDPGADPSPDPGVDPSPDPGIDPDPGGDSSTNKFGEYSDYHIQLKDFFPFCIPFDLYDFLTVLSAEPEAPVFHWEIPVPQLGQTFELDVDLSAWDDVARLFRTLELLAFIVGLALITRERILRS